MKRIKTAYPGVYFRETKRIGKGGLEKVFYIVYKKNGKTIEEKTGRQFVDKMTPAKASRLRGEIIEGLRKSKKEKKDEKKAQEAIYTIDRLWELYRSNRTPGKNLDTDIGRYNKFLKKDFGKKTTEQIIPLDIERITKRLSKTYAPQTVKHVLNLLTWIVNYGFNNNISSPLNFKVKKPSFDNTKNEGLLRPGQLKKLYQVIDNDPDSQGANMMRLALSTGMRRGSLFNLKWSDIEFHAEKITLRNVKGKKKDQNLDIPLNSVAKKILTHCSKTKGSKYVFPGKNGGKRVKTPASINRIKKEAGLPVKQRAIMTPL